MSKERLEEIKKAYITTDEVLNSPVGHQYGIDEKRAIKDFIFAINYLERQNKRYREVIKKAIDDLENECLWDALVALKHWRKKKND